MIAGLGFFPRPTCSDVVELTFTTPFGVVFTGLAARALLDVDLAALGLAAVFVLPA